MIAVCLVTLYRHCLRELVCYEELRRRFGHLVRHLRAHAWQHLRHDVVVAVLVHHQRIVAVVNATNYLREAVWSDAEVARRVGRESGCDLL